MENKSLFLDDWVVVDFLSKIDNFHTNSKYVELVISLLLNKFCEKQWGCKCCIGLEIQEKFQCDIPVQGHASVEDLNKIILNKVREDTPVDIIIAKKSSDIGVKTHGMNFQLKRFGKNKNKQDTQSLINYINVDCKQYGKTDSNLVILIESPEEIDLKLLQESIQTNNYPFKKIIFIGMPIKNYVDFMGIWPESGVSRFNLSTMQFDY